MKSGSVIAKEKGWMRMSNKHVLQQRNDPRISQEGDAIERYSASAEERDIIACFFEFQEIREFPSKIQKPVTERCVSGQLAQSESQIVLICKGEVEGKNNP